MSDKRIETAADAALEKLARELAHRQQHLDPDIDGDWESFTDREKSFYRLSVDWLLMFPTDIDAALNRPTTTT